MARIEFCSDSPGVTWFVQAALFAFRIPSISILRHYSVPTSDAIVCDVPLSLSFENLWSYILARPTHILFVCVVQFLSALISHRSRASFAQSHASSFSCLGSLGCVHRLFFSSTICVSLCQPTKRIPWKVVRRQQAALVVHVWTWCEPWKLCKPFGSIVDWCYTACTHTSRMTVWCSKRTTRYDGSTNERATDRKSNLSDKRHGRHWTESAKKSIAFIKR